MPSHRLALQMLEVVRRNDASRIVQCILQFGNDEQRDLVLQVSIFFHLGCPPSSACCPSLLPVIVAPLSTMAAPLSAMAAPLSTTVAR